MLLSRPPTAPCHALARLVACLALAAVTPALAGCGAGHGPAAPTASGSGPRPAHGTVVVVTRETHLSNHPLGDVGVLPVAVGDEARATCFVADATRNTGARGSAVRVLLHGERGFLPVRVVDDISEDPAVLTFLDADETALRESLPGCGGR